MGARVKYLLVPALIPSALLLRDQTMWVTSFWSLCSESFWLKIKYNTKKRRMSVLHEELQKRKAHFFLQFFLGSKSLRLRMVRRARVCSHACLCHRQTAFERNTQDNLSRKQLLTLFFSLGFMKLQQVAFWCLAWQACGTATARKEKGKLIWLLSNTKDKGGKKLIWIEHLE